MQERRGGLDSAWPAGTRRAVLTGLSGMALGAALPGAALAATDEEIDRAIAALIAPSRGPIGVAEAQAFLMENAGLSAMPGLVLAHRFSPLPRTETAAIMARITGEKPSLDWFDWMLWQEAHPNVVPTAGFVGLKRAVFEAIDPNFEIFLRDPWLDRERARIRFEEVTWGGVRKDGIPSLDNPALIPAGEADYLRDSDPVFGVSINGDVRAYPLRIMGWHEMFNEVIGGVPVALAYCTLCGAGILFETQVAGRPAPFVFGSSGFLYRSNKLMFDRETHSLWNQFTGKPVIGPLVESGLALKQRPVTIQPWGEWRAANPETRVLSLDTGHERDYGSGVVYNDYFSSESLMFPALVNQKVLKQKDYIFGIRRQGVARAWPLGTFAGGRVINDAVGDMAVVLVGDASG
ncbi:MAG: DUF3179 domain-containing protein, partial [Pseudomonadota bacterium]